MWTQILIFFLTLNFENQAKKKIVFASIIEAQTLENIPFIGTVFPHHPTLPLEKKVFLDVWSAEDHRGPVGTQVAHPLGSLPV